MLSNRKFDLNLLRVLLALDRTRRVTRAADLLEMSQSGFSSALARLRRHSADALFVRTSTGMIPTPYARRMIEAATTALAIFDERILTQPVFDAATAPTEFQFDMSDLAEMVFLPPLLGHLQRVAPHASVRCDPVPEESIQQALGNGQIDLALGYFPDLSGELFFQQRLYLHTFACIVRRGHPLDRGAMTAAAFARLGHIVVTAPSRAGGLLGSWLQQRGVKRRVVLRTPHHLSLAAIIEATDLVATVPLAVGAWFARHQAVQLVPLPYRPPIFPVHQHWHRRYHHDARHRWLRQQIALLFNEQSDAWLSIEQSLYGKNLRQRKNS